MNLSHHRILIFVDDVYEDLELWYPKLRLEEAGAKVVVAGPAGGSIYAGKHGYPCKSDAAIADMKESDFTGLVIPGGFMPDKLRRDPHVLKLTRDFHTKGKMIAFICHAGWIPISAKILKGVRATSTPGIRDDMENAGVTWVDESAVTDRHFITARRPPDLPDFMKAVLEFLGKENKQG